MKVLITADLHIGDYNEYNPTPFFRLNQFLKLADLIVQQAKLTNAQELWIAGDLLYVSRPIPRVMNVLKQFLTKIAGAGITIRAILGNHDVTVRSAETGIEQYNDYSLIPLLNIKNVYIYLDDIVKIDNRTVHFHSWVPGTTFESKHADILVAHGDANKQLSNFSDKLIDYSNYTKAFIGHIHKPFDDGKMVSPSVSIAHSYSDDPETSLVLFDLDTYQYSRISTKDQFLKFEYAASLQEKEILEKVNVSENVNAVVRVKQDNALAKVVDIQNIDLYSHLNKYLEKYQGKSKEFIQQALAASNVEATKTIDLNFELQTLQAQNFLSIKTLQFNFKDYKSLTVIEGAIGAGKSTLFKLLTYMFFGKVPGVVKASLKSVFADKKDQFCGVIFLKYKGNTYKIKRTFKTLDFWENDQIIEAESINERQKMLEEKLSFLEFWNILCIDQSSNGIFASMNDGSRVSFLSKFLKLDTVQKYSGSLSVMISGLKDRIEEQSLQLASLEGTLQGLDQFLSMHADVKELTDHELQQEMAIVKSQLEGVSAQIAEYEHKKYAYDFAVQKQNELQQKVHVYMDKDKSLQNLLQCQKIAFDNLHDASETEIDGYKSKLTLVNTKLAALESHTNVCPTCKQNWIIPNLNETIEKLKQAQNILRTKILELNNLHTSYVSASNKVSDTTRTLQNVHENLCACQNELNSLVVPEFHERDMSELKNQKNELNNNKDNLIRQIGTIEANNKIFNEYNNIIIKKEKILQEITALKANFIQNKEILENATIFNSKVLSNKGLLVATLLQEVSDKLNVDPKIKVQTITTNQAGTLIPTLNLQLYVEEYKQFIDYDMLSGGQKLVADIRFLACILCLTGKISTLFMDEVFKYLSDSAILDMSELLKELNIDTIFLTLHGNMQGNISNNIIHVSLSENGSEYIKL